MAPPRMEVEEVMSDVLKPSRELDRLVSEKLWGHTIYETDNCNGVDNLWIDPDSQNELPFYSTCLSDAEAVILELHGPYGIKINTNKDGWYCGIFEGPRCIAFGAASEIAHAICLAAVNLHMTKEIENEPA